MVFKTCSEATFQTNQNNWKQPSCGLRFPPRCGYLPKPSLQPRWWLSALCHLPPLLLHQVCRVLCLLPPVLPHQLLPCLFLPHTWTAPSLEQQPLVQLSREGLICDFTSVLLLWRTQKNTWQIISRTSPPSLPYISTVSAAVSPSPLSPCRSKENDILLQMWKQSNIKTCRSKENQRYLIANAKTIREVFSKIFHCSLQPLPGKRRANSKYNTLPRRRQVLEKDIS